MKAQQQQAERRKGQGADAGGSDSEPGEVQVAKKAKFAPIVWDGPGKATNGRGGGNGAGSADDASPVIVPDQSRWGSVKKDAAATAMDELEAFRRQQVRPRHSSIRAPAQPSSPHSQ